MIKNVKIELLKNNPFRPALNASDEPRIAYLMDNIAWDGYWPTSILPARPCKGGYQLAQGHRRREAAKRSGLTELPVDIEERTDDEMFTKMTRENTLDGSKTPGMLRHEVATSKRRLDEELAMYDTWEEYKSQCTRALALYENKMSWAITKKQGAGWNVITKHTGTEASGRQVAKALKLNRQIEQYPKLEKAIDLFPTIRQQEFFADNITAGRIPEAIPPITWFKIAKGLVAEYGDGLSGEVIQREIRKMYTSLTKTEEELTADEMLEKAFNKIIATGKTLTSAISEFRSMVGKDTQIGGMAGVLAKSDLETTVKAIGALYRQLGVTQPDREQIQ